MGDRLQHKPSLRFSHRVIHRRFKQRTRLQEGQRWQRREDGSKKGFLNRVINCLICCVSLIRIFDIYVVNSCGILFILFSSIVSNNFCTYFFHEPFRHIFHHYGLLCILTEFAFCDRYPIMG